MADSGGVGVVLCIIGKVGLGVGTIAVGIVFLVIFFVMVKKNNHEEKASGKDNE